MMMPKQMLDQCAEIMIQRGEEYGHLEENFDRISTIASVMLGKHVSNYEVAMMLLAVKLGRMQESKHHLDNYMDGINYMAIAAHFLKDEPPKDE